MKKEIQVGHVITTITLILTGLFFITKMDQRIALLEDRVLVQKERDANQDRQLAEAIIRLNAQMDRIDGKLDRIIERGPK